MFIPIKTKEQAKRFVVMTCKRQYGFAPDLKNIIIEHYNKKFIIFIAGGRKYIIKMYKDIPIATLINFTMPYDF